MTNLSALGVEFPLTYDQFDLPKLFFQRVFGLIGLAAWGWHILVNGGKIRHTPVEFLVLAFLAWVALSSAFSIHVPTALFGRYRRFEGLFSFINYAVVYFLAIQFADRPSRIRRIAQALFWSGLLVAFYGALQYFGADPSDWEQVTFGATRAFATYGNPDFLGGFICFPLFVSLGLALSEKTLWMRLIYWVGFLLSCFVLVIAFVRGAWIGCAIGFVLFAILAWRQRPEFRMQDWVLAGMSALAAVGAIVRSLSSTDEVTNFGRRLTSITKFDEGSAETRFQIWRAALSAIKDRPLFGFGADTFRMVFPRYKPAEYVRAAGYHSVADNAHNYPLQLAAGIGVLGMLMLYGIFGWAAVRSGRLLFGRRRGSALMVLVGFWVACAAYLTHLFFGPSVTGVTVLLWLSMGVVLAPTARSFEYKPGSMGYVAASIGVLLAVAGVAFNVVYLVADNAYLQSRMTSGIERVANAERAVRLNPWNDQYRVEVALAHVDIFYEYVRQAAVAQQAGDMARYGQHKSESWAPFKAAEAVLLDTMSSVPWEHNNYVFLTGLYVSGGQLWGSEFNQKAIEVGRRGIAIDPFGPAVRYQLASALSQAGDEEEAIEQLRVAHNLDPAYSEATLLLAKKLGSRGRWREALAVLKETYGSAPGTEEVRALVKELDAAAATETRTAP